MFSYRTLLKQAWDIAWKHKYLWFFGLFAALVSGGGSWEYQIFTQNFNQGLINGSYSYLSQILAIGELMKNFSTGFVNLFNYNWYTIINAFSVILLSAILLIFFLWLAIVSQIALINGSKKISISKKKEYKLSLHETITESHGHFWTVLALNIINKILLLFFFIIASLPLLLMAINNSTLSSYIYVILFVIFVPVSLGVSFIIKYAICYNIIDDESLVVSIEKAWRLFKKNWLISLEMAVGLFIINFLSSGLILILISLFLLPLLLLGLIFKFGWLVILTLIITIVIIAVFGSLLTTFQTASWTNLFIRIKDKGVLAKLERIFHRQK